MRHYLTTHSTHFIYGYMASDIWYMTTQIAREETRCRHISYSCRLAARVLLYASSHRRDKTYHGLCFTLPDIDIQHIHHNKSKDFEFVDSRGLCNISEIHGEPVNGTSPGNMILRSILLISVMSSFSLALLSISASFYVSV